MKYPLMNDSISTDDLNYLIDFLQTQPRLTNGSKVKEFEKSWSDWQGQKHSCMVNSGTSANLATMLALKTITHKNKIIVPPLTWVSDINAVLLAGFEPVFVDINLQTLALDTEKTIEAIDDDTAAVFLTHILGLNGLTDKLIAFLKEKNIPLIEDCCESHGATHNNKKIGTFGLASNFSFYFAHHMTTIEGGIISSQDETFINTCKMIRSHGMLRENPDINFKNQIENKFSELNPEFIFYVTGLNLRTTEINAVIGLNQLKNLDKAISKRNDNFKYFLEKLPNTIYKDYETKGMSNYSFLLLTENEDPEYFGAICKSLSDHQIEFRRGMSGGGNQLRQPHLKNRFPWKKDNFKNVEKVHFYGMYIGNYPELDTKDIDYIIKAIRV